MSQIQGSTGGNISVVIAAAMLYGVLWLGVTPERASAALRARGSEGRTRLISVTTVDHPIAAGENFAAILTRYGIPPEEIQKWYAAARSILDLRWIQAGRVLTLGFDETRRLGSVRYAMDGKREVVVRRNDQRLVAGTEVAPARIRVVGRRGAVFTTFYEAARLEGIPDQVVSDMVDTLSCRIDFAAQVRPGDRFRVLYEERVDEDGRVLGAGRVLAADFIGAAQSAAAFLVGNEEGEAVYVDAAGRSLDEDFLRYPLEFTRITSTFTTSRLHPVLKRRRPHNGVDLAAKSGTPVRAVGPGMVIWAAWKGGLGRSVEIDHGDQLVSAYAHLRGIDPKVHLGAAVERGQLIGWVGSSGLATGPHLHYAMFENGRYVNPLTLSRARSSGPIDRGQFQRVRSVLMARLRALPAEELGHAASTPPVSLSSLTQVRRLGPVALTL